MSHVLHVWPGSAPAEAAEARAQFQSLRGQPAEPGQRAALQAFLQALHERWPGPAADLAWNELPDTVAGATLSLSPAVAALDEALPVVYRLASLHGLTVHDTQTDEVVSPGADARETPAGIKFSFTPAAATQQLRAGLAPCFIEHGWKDGKGDHWFMRVTPLAKLQFYGRMTNTCLEFALELKPKYPAAMKTAVAVLGGWGFEVDLRKLASGRGLPLNLGWVAVDESNQYTLAMRGWPDVDVAMHELLPLLDAALSQLNTVDDWQALDHLVNRVPDAECLFRDLRRPPEAPLMNFHADLAVAKAAGASDFALLASERLGRHRARESRMTAFLEDFMAACGLPT